MIDDPAHLPATGTADATSAVLSTAADGAPIMLPEGISLATASFDRVGTDLVITTPEGQEVVVRDYFAGTFAELVAPDGTRMSGDLASSLAGSVAPAQVAQAGWEASGEPIGEVDNVTGQVFATRADGTRVELRAGDPVFMGDILETGDDGAVGVVLADATSFSMAQNGRMVLDEMIYDPSSGGGSIAISIVHGLFSFVSGEIAKADPDAMVVNTPVATIGIRGTQVGLDLTDGTHLGVVLMEELSGFVGEVVVTNGAGVVVMNQAHQYTYVGGAAVAPTAVAFIDVDRLVELYKAALAHLPTQGGTENRYEDPAEADDLASLLNDFDTAAGTDSGPGAEPPVGPIQVVDGDYTQRTDITNQPLTSGGPTGGGNAPQGGGSDDDGDEAFFGAGSGASTALTGNDGDDILIGGAGEDILDGGAGNDILVGNGGDDTLLGGDGEDALNGGTGNNQLIGGGGADVAIYLGAYMDYSVHVEAGSGVITIVNEAEGISDVLTNVELLQFAGDGDGEGGGVVAVDAIGLAPTVEVTTGPAVEDMPFSIDISIGLAHSLVGVASIILTGLPTDAILESASEGLLLPGEDGNYVLDTDALTGLTMTPPQNFNGDLSGMQVIVTTTEGVTADPVPFSVNVTAVNDAPYLELNAGLAIGAGDSAIIDESLLAIVDVDDPADSIVYEVTGLPQHGILYLGETALEVGATFTQFDIDNGILTYQQLDQEVAAGTYFAGIPESGRGHPINVWKPVDLYAFGSGGSPYVDGDGRLDLSAADNSLLSLNTRGIGVVGGPNAADQREINYDPATGGSDAVAIDFRADVSEVRLNLNFFLTGDANERGVWEAFDAYGNLVGSGNLDSSNVIGDDTAGTATIQTGDGALFRYLVVRADSVAGAENQGSSFHVRAVEFDVAPGPNSDSFSFRAEDAGHLALADQDTSDPGYTVVDGEATFNIAIDQNMAA